ncbi:MAG TPA: peptidoglycan-binding domain-containing protein [Polyangia bacterium]|nr:peptidoglycan-binding domain-containing protein [Polyangia bacterium]
MTSARKLMTGAMPLALAALAACGHTRSVAPPSEPAAASAAPKPAAPPHEPPPGATPPRDRDSETQTGLPLASSPAGLLKPGATKMIQQRLSNDGVLPEEQQTGELDAITKAALAKFQTAHDLPATGDPDSATVVKLGLDPRKIFRGEGEPAP